MHTTHSLAEIEATIQVDSWIRAHSSIESDLDYTIPNMPSIKPLLSSTESVILLTLFVLSRLALLAVFFVATGGQEVASDVLFHKMIINEPLAILMGTAQHVASYPPFQWVAEWPLYHLFSWHFSQVISIRLMMISIECMTFAVLVYNAQNLFISKKMAMAVAIFFLISPHQYFTTVFFVQEDILSQLFMLLAVLLLLADKRTLAITVLVCGILIAKIFFIIPLFYVIFFHGKLSLNRRVIHGCLAMAPIVIVYYIAVTNALTNGGSVPIRDFTPDAAYAANYWVLILKAYPHALMAVKNTSLLLSVFCQFVLIAIFFTRYRKQSHDIGPAILLAVPLAVFLATFYQHLPEYLLLIWPVMALMCSTILQQLLLAAAISFAWLPKIAHGLQTVINNVGSEAQARSDILGPLLDSISFDGQQLHSITLAAQSVVYTLMLVFMCRVAWIKNRQSSMPRQ